MAYQIVGSSISCGIGQLSGVYNVSLEENIGANLMAIKPFMYNPNYSNRPMWTMILFSDAISTYQGGKALAAYIEKYGLGKVEAEKPKINFNTKNTIQMWMWEVPLIKDFEEHFKKIEEEQAAKLKQAGKVTPPLSATVAIKPAERYEFIAIADRGNQS